MYTDLILAVLFCLGVVVSVILFSRKKNNEVPPIVTGTMPNPPEPTPEETGPPVNTNDEFVLPEVTPLPNGGGGIETTPTELDKNNEQLS